MNFEIRLKQLREENDLTRKEMADKLQLSYWALSKYETGERFPDPDILNKIADYFGVSLDYLMGKTDIRTPYNQAEPTPEEKYPDVTDVEEAMEILLNQPGLMLKGEALEDEDKIILANAIQAGLRMADEIRKKRREQEGRDDEKYQ